MLGGGSCPPSPPQLFHHVLLFFLHFLVDDACQPPNKFEKMIWEIMKHKLTLYRRSPTRGASTFGGGELNYWAISTLHFLYSLSILRLLDCLDEATGGAGDERVGKRGFRLVIKCEFEYSFFIFYQFFEHVQII